MRYLFIILSLLVPVNCFAALSASTVFEVRNGGSDTNGGGFVTGASGTDFTQQNSAQYALTNGTTAGTTTVLTASAAANMVGNIAYIAGGTGSITGGWYQITAASVGTSITVDRNTGLTAGTGVTINVGGAFATPGLAASVASVDGMMIWIKSSTTYTMTTSTAGAAGPILFASAIRCKLEGYQTTRGDRGTKPTISAGSVTSIMMASTNGNDFQQFVNLKLDGNNGSGVSGFNATNARDIIEDCDCQNCGASSQIGFTGTIGAIINRCRSINNVTGFSAYTVSNSVSSGDVTGFQSPGSGAHFIHCLAYLATGVGFDGNANGAWFSYCTANGCTSHGFSFGNPTTNTSGANNCLSTNNGGAGFTTTGTLNQCRLFVCADYNNTGTRTSGTFGSDYTPINVAADPYVAVGSQDFRPNSTSNGGALLRATALGPVGLNNSQDVGACQHADPTSTTTILFLDRS